MTIIELIKYLKQQQGKDILLILQGIIIVNIFIEYMKVKQQEKSIILENEKNRESNIGFNTSQLMKITKIQENEILLEFDPLQKIIIKVKTKDKIKEAINYKEQ